MDLLWTYMWPFSDSEKWVVFLPKMGAVKISKRQKKDNRRPKRDFLFLVKIPLIDYRTVCHYTSDRVSLLPKKGGFTCLLLIHLLPDFGQYVYLSVQPTIKDKCVILLINLVGEDLIMPRVYTLCLSHWCLDETLFFCHVGKLTFRSFWSCCVQQKKCLMNRWWLFMHVAVCDIDGYVSFLFCLF